jgi:hypothetical protein
LRRSDGIVSIRSGFRLRKAGRFCFSLHLGICPTAKRFAARGGVAYGALLPSKVLVGGFDVVECGKTTAKTLATFVFGGRHAA